MEYDTNEKFDAYKKAPSTTTVNIDGVDVEYRKGKFELSLSTEDVVKLSKHLKKVRKIIERYDVPSVHIIMRKRHAGHHDDEWSAHIGSASWTIPAIRETGIPS